MEKRDLCAVADDARSPCVATCPFHNRSIEHRTVGLLHRGMRLGGVLLPVEQSTYTRNVTVGSEWLICSDTSTTSRPCAISIDPNVLRRSCSVARAAPARQQAAHARRPSPFRAGWTL